MMTARECRANRKVLKRAEQMRQVAHALRATAHQRYRRPIPEPDGFPPKLFVDVTALYAHDCERQHARAESEMWPTGMALGSTT